MLASTLSWLALASYALATIAPTSPVASTTCSGGKPCKIQWVDDGHAPQIGDFGAVSVGLYVGGTYAQTMIQNFGIVRSPDINMTISPVISPKVGPNADFYFIKFISAGSNGKSLQPLTAFSARFTLTNMTGRLSAIASAQAASETSSVETVNPTSTPPAASAPGANAAVSTSAVATSGAETFHHSVFAVLLMTLSLFAVL